ncbi:MAG: glycine cleavage system protein GcvH [Euryarchaeota archaeon]|nr:glycine cleavage system protein GcvH [Euryarchaeota archaeon]
MYPEDLKYTKTHEWVKVEGNRAKVGITHYAQEQLNDIVYVELPEVGTHFNKGEAFAVVESVKSASDIYMPVTGTVVAVNEDIVDSPELLNEDPYTNWMVEMELENPAELEELMDVNTYKEYVEKEEQSH